MQCCITLATQGKAIELQFQEEVGNNGYKMKLVVDNSHQVMKPTAGAGLMKAPKAEKRGYSRRVSLEKKLKLRPGIKNYDKTRIVELLKAALVR
ncbi:hypothetical protein SASPL_135389 [Salvia splendens]|uniref:Uncharacterized protein n=1 Tax=Salvia splendens TaxID=180675 RepID=A0A8X8ZFQ8_SALSN|nr:hypothetical protein SASPL_135389 [Salvia splendens]